MRYFLFSLYFSLSRMSAELSKVVLIHLSILSYSFQKSAFSHSSGKEGNLLRGNYSLFNSPIWKANRMAGTNLTLKLFRWSGGTVHPGRVRCQGESSS